MNGPGTGGPVLLSAEAITIALGGVAIVEQVVLRAAAGSVVGVLGPNGCGKTTLLRSLFRALRPQAGAVRVGGDDVWRLSAREAARRTAAVTQDHGTDFEFSVAEVVALGRLPHQGLLDVDGPADRSIVADALRQTGTAHLADRSFRTLSGGERQRVLIARALAQQPALLVLDEPTNHLDVAAQLDILGLVTGLGLTVVTALHDLNLAAGYCDQIAVMVDGAVIASGPPEQTLTPELIERVYGVTVHRGVNPLTGKLHLTFAPARGAATQPLMKEEAKV